MSLSGVPGAPEARLGESGVGSHSCRSWGDRFRFPAACLAQTLASHPDSLEHRAPNRAANRPGRGKLTKPFERTHVNEGDASRSVPSEA
eukprot:12170740-Alexandrium_andersonii.AAC.1